MTRLFLVRHGETDWNREKRYMGQRDIPLNALGRAQAQATAKLLKEEPIAAVYSSDLSRAAETARIIAQKHKLNVILSKELREMNYGHWEGKLFDEVKKLCPQELEQLENAPLEFAPSGGESRKQLFERVIKKLTEIIARHPNESVVVVSHGGPIRAIINYAIGYELGIQLPYPFYTRAFGVDLCSVSVLSTDDKTGLKIISLNNTYHLRDSESGSLQF